MCESSPGSAPTAMGGSQQHGGGYLCDPQCPTGCSPSLPISSRTTKQAMQTPPGHPTDPGSCAIPTQNPSGWGESSDPPPPGANGCHGDRLPPIKPGAEGSPSILGGTHQWDRPQHGASLPWERDPAASQHRGGALCVAGNGCFPQPLGVPWWVWGSPEVPWWVWGSPKGRDPAQRRPPLAQKGSVALGGGPCRGEEGGWSRCSALTLLIALRSLTNSIRKRFLLRLSPQRR